MSVLAPDSAVIVESVRYPEKSGSYVGRQGEIVSYDASDPACPVWYVDMGDNVWVTATQVRAVGG